MDTSLSPRPLQRVPTSTSTASSRSTRDHVHDVVYEHQRGYHALAATTAILTPFSIFVFGDPNFSSSLLHSLDPAPFVCITRNLSAPSMSYFDVPDPSWEWAQPGWIIDMTGDVDADGWQYAFSFRSSWHNHFSRFSSFVRRRRWTRLRRTTDAQGNPIVAPSHGRTRKPATPVSSITDPWIRQLQALRSDREKVEYVRQSLASPADAAPTTWSPARLAQVFCNLEYNWSRLTIEKLLVEHGVLSPNDLTLQHAPLFFNDPGMKSVLQSGYDSPEFQARSLAPPPFRVPV